MRFEPFALQAPFRQFCVKFLFSRYRCRDRAKQFERCRISSLQLIEPSLRIVSRKANLDRPLVISLNKIDELIAHCAASSMRHRVAGAVLPCTRSASVMATYVFGGKLPAARQLDTRGALAAVTSATPELPPRASKTWSAVSRISRSMPRLYFKFLEIAISKKLRCQKI